MSAVFLKLLNLSITASWLILAVILVRFLLKKAPKWISCVLWALVAVRLVCPVSLESNLSLIPDIIGNGSIVEQWTDQWIGDPYYIYKGDYVWDAPHEGDTVSDFGWISTDNAPSYTDDGDGYWEYTPQKTVGSTVVPILSYIWLAGVVALLLYALISYIKLKKTVGASVSVRDNILACDEVKSPFILGIIKPLIYVPSSMKGETLDYVITHESAHIQRHDHWWKPLGYFLLTVYWFNPMIWLAYILLCRDIEMACDEKVIRELDNNDKAAYSQALLNCSFPRRRITACPLAFGEVGVKKRVKSVLNYKKPAFWVIVLAVIACVVVAVCFLTNPKNYSEEIQVNGQIYLRQENEVETLPTGSYELGRLLSILHRTKEHPSEDFSATNLDAKYAGNMLYQSGRDISTVYLEDLSGFYIPFTVVESTPDEVTFEAQVLEIHDGYFLVAPEASWVLNSADRIEVPMMSMAPAPEPQVGDIIEITCSGEILETYPARLSKVYGIKVAKKASTVTKWFDCLHGDEMVWDGRREINLDEFPGVTFRWFSEKLEAVTEKETITLYTGMPIWSVFFCDLTGDGLSELCSSLSFGSGMIDNRVMIYDYANGVSYSMEDRGVTDYILRQNESDGQLYVDKKAYMGGGLLSTGRLVFEDDCLLVLWPEKPNDSIREITDPTDDPNFTYDTAVEKIFEDENNEYFIGGLYSQHIIVYYTDGTQEDIVTALNAGKATIADLDKFGIRYWAEPKEPSLDTAISSAILEHYASDEPDGLIHVESHVLLANEAMSGTPQYEADDHAEKVIAYLLVHHVKYSTYGGTLEAVGGSYIPTAITFKITDFGEYVLEEYWEPRDGSYYAKDIRGKFPGTAADDALNDQAYIEDLKKQNYNKALSYLNNSISLDVQIEELLNEIQSSPAHSSNPGDYIREHEGEYDVLIDFGKYTLQYCFSEFLNGEQTDLRGHIMASVCNDIAEKWGEQLIIDGDTPVTGQGWFDEFQKNAEALAKQYSIENLEKYYPASFQLLQMSDDDFMIKKDLKH